MTLKIPISTKSKARLQSNARRLGLIPEEYARELLEERLKIDHEARTRTFEELLAPFREDFRKSGMTLEELDELVDRARTEHYQEMEAQRRRRRDSRRLRRSGGGSKA